jgi:hypothetical protein
MIFFITTPFPDKTFLPRAINRIFRALPCRLSYYSKRLVWKNSGVPGFYFCVYHFDRRFVYEKIPFVFFIFHSTKLEPLLKMIFAEESVNL